MENKDKPAYPFAECDESLVQREIHYGLSKRELFTMAAMQGLLTSMKSPTADHADNLAIIAVRIADATLSALSTKEKGEGA